MTIKIKVEGFSALRKAFYSVTRKYNRGYQEGLRQELTKIYDTSQKFCPIDTGYLRSTGFIEITGSGFNSRGYVGYSAEYAMIVHEALHFSFKTPGTGAKYLERAIKRHERHIVPNIAKVMRKANS